MTNPTETTESEACAEAGGQVERVISRLQHTANEWADTATNGLQWLRNIKDGISTVDEAIIALESDIKYCRMVAANETVEKPLSQNPTHQNRHSAIKLPSCRRISTTTANACWVGSGAFHAVFLFRSWTLSLPIDWAIVCSSRGFSTASTTKLRGASAASVPIERLVRRK